MPECLSEASRGADENFAGARLPAVLLHDGRLLDAPVVLVHDARRGLEEVFVEFWPTRGGVGKQWGTGTVRSKTEAKVPSWWADLSNPFSSTFRSSALSVRKLVSPSNSSRGSRLPSKSSSLTLVLTRPASTRLVRRTASRRSRARSTMRAWCRSNSVSSEIIRRRTPAQLSSTRALRRSCASERARVKPRAPHAGGVAAGARRRILCLLLGRRRLPSRVVVAAQESEGEPRRPGGRAAGRASIPSARLLKINARRPE